MFWEKIDNDPDFRSGINAVFWTLSLLGAVCVCLTWKVAIPWTVLATVIGLTVFGAFAPLNKTTDPLRGLFIFSSPLGLVLGLLWVLGQALGRLFRREKRPEKKRELTALEEQIKLLQSGSNLRSLTHEECMEILKAENALQRQITLLKEADRKRELLALAQAVNEVCATGAEPTVRTWNSHPENVVGYIPIVSGSAEGDRR